MFVNKTISRTSTVKTLCIVAIQIREILHRSCHHKSYAGNHFLTILSKFHRFRRISFLRKSKIYRKPSTRSINRNRFISHQSTGSRLNHNLQLIFLNGSRIIDIGKLKNWAVEAMQWANAEGLINGKSNSMLDPQGKATRAETAAILMRFMQNIAK